MEVKELEHNGQSWLENKIHQVEMKYMQKLRREHPLPTDSKRYCEKMLEINQNKLDALREHNIEIDKQLAQIKKYKPVTNGEKLMAAFKINK
jgi:hypothetical protein